MISALNTVVVPEEALVKRQLELEETYKIRGIERARKLITDALQNGGIMNLPMTQRMLTSAYEVAAAAIDEMRNVKAPGHWREVPPVPALSPIGCPDHSEPVHNV